MLSQPKPIKMGKYKKFVSQYFVVSEIKRYVSNYKVRALTAGPDDSCPSWSKDSRSLLFLRANQAWIMPFHGGESYQLTDFAIDISSQRVLLCLFMESRVFFLKKYLRYFVDLQFSPAGNAISFTALVYLDDVRLHLIEIIQIPLIAVLFFRRYTNKSKQTNRSRSATRSSSTRSKKRRNGSATTSCRCANGRRGPTRVARICSSRQWPSDWPTMATRSSGGWRRRLAI
jgi:dipeptidyl aminopeptidase/acylaminoacyl peptidase